MPSERYVLGVDVGGTFTDFALVRLSDGRAWFLKTPSTPDDPSRAIAAGLPELLDGAAAGAEDVRYFGHGTTVATNALITDDTAVTGLITTEGFRDILEIRRQRQPHNYDIRIPKPPPLVPRHLRREIRERTYLLGPSDTPPELGALGGILDDFRGEGVEAVAISFLHSYHNPAHEAAVAAAVRERLPGAFVCASHEVVAEFREFERTTTTVLNASLGPVVSRYLERLGERTRAMGIVAPKILQSPRRRRLARGGGRDGGPLPDVGAGGGSHRGRLSRRPGRVSGRHHLRRRGNEHRRVPHREPPAARRQGARAPGAPHPVPDGRRAFGGRRRGQHRTRGLRRLRARGSAERRGQSGPRLLRPGGNRTHRDRRQRRARAPFRRHPTRRPHDPATRSRAPRDRRPGGGPDGARGGGGGPRRCSPSSTRTWSRRSA